MSKSIITANLLLSYGILFLVLFLTIGFHKFAHAQLIGNYVDFALIALISLLWTSYNTYRIVNNKVAANFKNNSFTFVNIAINPKIFFCIMMWMPFAGAIVNYVLLRQQRHLYVRAQLALDPEWKFKKEPMQVQILLMIVTLVVVLAIWLVYAIIGHVEGHTVPGIFDVLLSPIQGFIDGAEIIIYLLIMGAFLQVINASKALEAGIGRLTKKLRGKELIIIPVIMLLFSIGGTTFGMCEETIAFYAIVMPIVLAAGFDGITGVIIILFGAGLGVCSSIINPFMIMTSVDAVNAAIPTMHMSTYDGMFFRIFIYVIFLVTGITFTTLYARRVKNDPKKSLVYEFRHLHLNTFKFDEKAIPEFTLKRQITLIVFALCFVMLIMGAIPWTDLTHWDGFDRLDSWLTNNFPFIATGVGAIGGWYLASFSLLFLTGAVIVQAMNWQGGNHFYREVVIGAKDFLSVAFVIAVARGISLILTSSGFGDLIADGVSHALSIDKILGTLLLFLAFIVISVFIPSTSGFAYTIFGPIAAPAMAQASVQYSIAGGIASTSIANGLVNLSSPTAGPFVIGCEMAKVPLKNFYKSAWKLLAILLGIAIVLLVVGVYLPPSIMGQ